MKKIQKEITTFVVISSLLLLGYTFLIQKSVPAYDLWKISCGDCITCSKCEINCVKSKSAVVAKIDSSKATNRLYNPAYFRRYKGAVIDTSVANQVCPTGAIVRTILSDSFASYRVNEALCTGCGKCVRASKKGDREFCLVIDPASCLDCNECSIAAQCPVNAVQRGGSDE